MKQVVAISTGGIIGTGLAVALAPSMQQHLSREFEPRTFQALSTVGGLSALLLSALQGSPLKSLALSSFGSGLLVWTYLNRARPRPKNIRAVEVEASITVGLGIERVFDFWADASNFPFFMSHIQNVVDLGNGRSRWAVAGPDGLSITWDTCIVVMKPLALIAWVSSPESDVQHKGVVSFKRVDDTTTVTVKMSYNTPAGAFGFSIASLFGFDPKFLLEKDLERMKALLERHARQRAEDRQELH